MKKQLKNRFIEEWSGWDWLGKMNVGGDYMPPEYMIFGKKYENMVPVGGPDGVAVMKPYRAGGEGGYEPDYKTIGLTSNDQLAVLDYISYSQAQQMFCPESFAVELDGRLHLVEDTLPNKQTTLIAGANITITPDKETGKDIISATGGQGGGYEPDNNTIGLNKENKLEIINLLQQITALNWFAPISLIPVKTSQLTNDSDFAYTKDIPTTYVKDQQASGNTLTWHDPDGTLHNWTPASEGGINGINLNGEAVSIKEGVADIDNVQLQSDSRLETSYKTVVGAINEINASTVKGYVINAYDTANEGFKSTEYRLTGISVFKDTSGNLHTTDEMVLGTVVNVINEGVPSRVYIGNNTFIRIATTPELKDYQKKLVAGNYITIDEETNTISAEAIRIPLYIHTVDFNYNNDWHIICRTVTPNSNQYADINAFFNDTRKIISLFGTKPNVEEPSKCILQLGSMGATGYIMTYGFDNGLMTTENITSDMCSNFTDRGVEPL